MNQNPKINIPGGFLIAFEGIDGSGKTTVARRTAKWLTEKNYQAVYLKEPTDGPYGRQLRELMVSSNQRDPQLEFDLFIKDRQEDVNKNITPVLSEGGVVCIDRYYISSMAYQGALGIDTELIRTTNEAFAPPPNLILRFKIPVEHALKRIAASRTDGANQFEQREYLEKVDANFNKMPFSQMIDIDATQPADTVYENVVQVVSTLIKDKAASS